MADEDRRHEVIQWAPPDHCLIARAEDRAILSRLLAETRDLPWYQLAEQVRAAYPIRTGVRHRPLDLAMAAEAAQRLAEEACR